MGAALPPDPVLPPVSLPPPLLPLPVPPVPPLVGAPVEPSLGVVPGSPSVEPSSVEPSSVDPPPPCVGSGEGAGAASVTDAGEDGADSIVVLEPGAVERRARTA